MLPLLCNLFTFICYEKFICVFAQQNKLLILWISTNTMPLKICLCTLLSIKIMQFCFLKIFCTIFYYKDTNKAQTFITVYHVYMELYHSNTPNLLYATIYHHTYLGLFNVLVTWISVNFYVDELDFIPLINNDTIL